jgi:AhpD family alkylhydroperoxidase
VARLPYVDPAGASPEVREALEALPPLNIFRTLAHAETALRPALRLGQAILTRAELDPVLRELAILRVARMTGAEYEWVQHVAIGLAVGVRDEQVAALEAGDAQAGCFSAEERLVLRFATELMESDEASEATVSAAREAFSDREVVELVLTCGYYRMLAALMRTAAIDLDEPAGTAVLEGPGRPEGS